MPVHRVSIDLQSACKQVMNVELSTYELSLLKTWRMQCRIDPLFARLQISVLPAKLASSCLVWTPSGCHPQEGPPASRFGLISIIPFPVISGIVVCPCVPHICISRPSETSICPVLQARILTSCQRRKGNH